MSVLISVVYARALISELEARGLPAAQLLERCHLDPARLKNIREKLSLDEHRAVTRAAVDLTGDEGIGLAAGSRAPLNALQIVAPLTLSQFTVRDACQAFARYAALVSEGPRYELVEGDELATWTCSPAFPTHDVSRIAIDYLFAMVVRIGKRFRPAHARAETRLTAVHFQHAEPSYAARYSEVFRCPVHFEQPKNGLVFPRSILDKQQDHADATVGMLMRESAERLLREAAPVQSWGERTRTLLRYSPDLGSMTLESVAHKLELGPRGLSRRLRVEGLSFSGLLDEARCRYACEQLAREDVTAQALAEELGFSEASAFFRAFKRWTGCTPSEHRRKLRHEVASVPSTLQRSY